MICDQQAAKIHAEVDGTPGQDDMPGALVFSTTPDGSASPYNQERMRITGSGQMGLGTNNPVQQAGTGLHIHNASGQTRIKLTNNVTGSTANDGFDIIQEHNNDVHILNHENGILKIGTNDAERLRIDSAGRLLLGTTTEGEHNADNLTIADSGNCGLTLRSGSSSYGTIYFSDATSGNAEYDGYIDYNQSTSMMRFGTASTTRAVIDSSGRMGLGTVSPSAPLHISNASPKIILTDSDNSSDISVSSIGGVGVYETAFDSTFKTNSAERMRIDSAGRLLYI